MTQINVCCVTVNLPNIGFRFRVGNGRVSDLLVTLSVVGHKKGTQGVPTVAQGKQIRLVCMRMGVQSLASLSGLGIQCCCELWYKSQTQLRSHVAVAVA